MNFLDLILFQLLHTLTLPHPGALRSPWRVKSSGVRQSKTTKWPLLAALGGKVLRKRDGQIGSVSPFPLRGSPLTSKIVWRSTE